MYRTLFTNVKAVSHGKVCLDECNNDNFINIRTHSNHCVSFINSNARCSFMGTKTQTKPDINRLL